ncbi:MAG TPA: long-chain fatty acid--CoA ligase [Rhodanobacteraceae bacterium]|nr:long-chain fatty acid--CoA ligase [Rhodanobacteraceae bacterium]
MPLTQTVLEVARTHPDRVAIATAAERLTYAELVSDSRRLIAAIRHLQAKQARPPRPARETRGIPIVAISTTSAFETGRIFAGLAGYRVVSATIDPRWPLAHQTGVIVSSGAGVAVSDSAELATALGAAGWTGTTIAPIELHRLEATLPPAELPTVRAGDEAFLMLFSSGTTHDPKAFLKTRRQYRDNFSVSSAYLEPLPGVTTWAPGPVSYSLTLWALLECLASGGSAYLADAFDPLAAGHFIAAHAITRIVTVPAMVGALAAVARREPRNFAGLRLIVTGGAYLPPSIRAAVAAAIPGARLISYYGAAEIGFIGDSRSGDGTLIDLYRGIEAELRRDDGSPIPTTGDELGTIWIRASACSDGYVAGTSAEPLVDAGGWATVHDQGRWAGGALRLVGRAGDIANTGGHKVSLAEVERAFDGAPGVRAACAITVPDARRGTLVALVVEADAGVRKDALVELARTRLAPQYVPRRWYRVDALPRTVGGKVRRGATVEQVTRGEVTSL